MTDQNLYCKSSFMIGLFGSLYYIGYALYGVYLKQSDRYGRKAILITSCAFQGILWATLHFSDNYIVYYVCLFLCGIATVRSTVLYIYVTEWFPAGKKIFPGALCLASGLVVPVVTWTLYFYFGGKNWKVAVFPSIIFSIISFILSCFIPESPSYLHAK